MAMINRKLLLIFIQVVLYVSPLFLISQTSTATSGIENPSIPLWIKMIENPDVNFYDAVKVYDEYWKSHVKPADAEEEMSEGDISINERKREEKREVKKDRNRVLSEEELKSKNDGDLMNYHIKRFEQWMREVKPFVQEDGRILSDKERKDIWEKQQEEIKQQQK